jgi:hypothetical protein
MAGASGAGRPPLEVRREFFGSRLEAQVLVRTYELVVPMVRRQLATAAASWTESLPAECRMERRRIAQGA